MKTFLQKITLLFSFLVLTFMLNAQELVPSIYATNGGSSTSQSKTVTDWLFHGDGVNNSSVGTSSGGAFSIGAYIFLDTPILAPHAGRQIEEVEFFVVDPSFYTATYELEIYTSQTGAADYSETLNTADLVAGWNTVVLATPYSISGTQSLYIGYVISTTTNGMVNGTDAGPGVADGNYYIFNGGGWSPLSGIVDRNFNIKAGVGGATLSNDVGMLSIDMDDILVGGTVDVEGTLINLGTTALNSVDVNWQIDGGDVNTQSLSGLNLNTAETYSFVHDVSWSTTPGLHTLDVWVANMNGNGDDENTANDTSSKGINVASNSTNRLPLFEEFTSSTCNPCQWFNSTHFNAFIGANEPNLSLIKYQMNWPGAGDPYYTEEGGVRRTFYGVSGVPTTYLDGNDPNFFGNPTSLQPELDNRYSIPSYFSMMSGYEVDGDNITVEVIVNPYIEGNYTLHIAVVEVTTTGNATTNGETSFENVMMKMLPDASGTSINFVLDTAVTTNYTFDMSTTNVEEMSDLAVIAFVQNNTTKEVMQSVNSTENGIGVDENSFNSVMIFPNPINSILNVKNAEGLNIAIYDLTGRILFSKNNISFEERINLSNLVKGAYFLRLSDGIQVRTEKIIINK